MHALVCGSWHAAASERSESAATVPFACMYDDIARDLDIGVNNSIVGVNYDHTVG